MRVIKFRVWDCELKEMIYDAQDESGYESDGFTDFLHQESRYKVMQFTGLLDKSGKEIYEGDILAINNISNIKYEVRFGNYEPYGSNERQQGFYLYDDSDNSTIPLTENYKIVGNIYENPELLGGAS